MESIDGEGLLNSSHYQGASDILKLEILANALTSLPSFKSIHSSLYIVWIDIFLFVLHPDRHPSSLNGKFTLVFMTVEDIFTRHKDKWLTVVALFVAQNRTTENIRRERFDDISQYGEYFKKENRSNEIPNIDLDIVDSNIDTEEEYEVMCRILKKDQKYVKRWYKWSPVTDTYTRRPLISLTTGTTLSKSIRSLDDMSWPPQIEAYTTLIDYAFYLLSQDPEMDEYWPMGPRFGRSWLRPPTKQKLIFLVYTTTPHRKMHSC